jgi:hypothetical protein
VIWARSGQSLFEPIRSIAVRYDRVNDAPGEFIGTRFPVFEFSIKRGEIPYLGNLSLSGGAVTGSLDFERRDLEFFLSKNSALRSADITTRQLTQSSYFVSGEENSFHIKGTIWGVP